MRHLKKILDRFNGVSFTQEYLCLDPSSFEQPPRLLLFIEGKYQRDVTHEHVFSGYSPLLFSFGSSGKPVADWPERIQLRLVNDTSYLIGKGDEKDALALLEMKKLALQQEGDTSVIHYQGIKGSHHFLSRFQQGIMALSNSWFAKKKDNVFLPNELYRQVQIAYALPRTIALVTVGHKGLFNLFPTDLHGPLGDGYYLDSLRQKGLALQQVKQSGRMLITEVEAASYKEAYRLGRNHMQPLRPREELPFSPSNSDHFQLPVPLSAIRVRELELINEMPLGIHQLLLFSVANIRELFPGKPGLAHIHAVYASWRKKQGLGGNYLLR